MIRMGQPTQNRTESIYNDNLPQLVGEHDATQNAFKHTLRKLFAMPKIQQFYWPYKFMNNSVFVHDILYFNDLPFNIQDKTKKHLSYLVCKVKHLKVKKCQFYGCSHSLNPDPLFVCFIIVFSDMITYCFPPGLLPYSVHRMDDAHLLSSYSNILFYLIVQCIALGLIESTLSKPCSEDRILNFLTGFSVALVSIVSVLRKHSLIFTTPLGGEGC